LAGSLKQILNEIVKRLHITMRKIYILLLAFCLSANLFAQTKKSKNVEQKPKFAQVAFPTMTWDFGNINERGGYVSHDFEFTNTGTIPLIIEDVKTSCGCTSTQWPREPIAPGAKGVIKAVFQPLGRQGSFNKEITLVTNTSPSGRILKITGYVIPNNNDVGEMYKYQYGNIAVNTNSLNFGRIPDTGYDSSYIGIFNIGVKTLEILKIVAPENIVITKNASRLVPYTDLTLYVNFYPVKPADYGQIKQEILVYTNDDTLPIKKFYVNAEVFQDFSKLTKSDLKKAPKIQLEKNAIDFGDVHYFEYPERSFQVVNKGKRDLVIKRLVRSCNCIYPTIDKMVLKKGEKAKLKVKWDLKNIVGPDEKSFKIITNDPSQSEIDVQLKINVTP
jgi:hypothetical protein